MVSKRPDLSSTWCTILPVHFFRQPGIVLKRFQTNLVGRVWYSTSTNCLRSRICRSAVFSITWYKVATTTAIWINWFSRLILRPASMMCRNTLSVGWDGVIYDCDFNQMLDLKVQSVSQHLEISTATHWCNAMWSSTNTVMVVRPDRAQVVAVLLRTISE